MAWSSCYTADFQAASIVGAGSGTTAANDRRLVESLNGSFSFVADAIDTGRDAIRFDANGGAANFSLASMTASASRYGGMLFRFRLPTLTTDAVICGFVMTTTTDNIRILVTTAGALRYSFDNGTSFTTASGVTITAGTVYRFEVFCDCGTGTTHTLKIRIDGTEVVNTTGGASSNTITTYRFGFFATTASQTLDLADCAAYNDVGEYATISDWRVLGLEPVADGSHNAPSGIFTNQAGSAMVNATTNSYTYIDDAPAGAPSLSDFVRQVSSGSTNYLEHVYRAMPSGYDNPVLVCLAIAQHPNGASTANNSQVRLRVDDSDSSTSAEAIIDASVASNTLEYRKHHYPTIPGTGASWTTADVLTNQLRTRFGFSTDTTPNPCIDALMVFVVAPVTSGPSNQEVDPPAGAATASSPTATPALSVPPAAATASASSLLPTPQLKVSPAAASATASGAVPTPQLKLSPAAASATASAPVPSVSAGQTVSPPAGTASASAPIPAVQLQLSPAVGSAAASSPVSTPQVRVSPAAAGATASAPVATPQLQLSPAAASASASGPVPTVAAGQTIAPPAAAATASGPVPTPQLKLSPAAAAATASAPTPTVAGGQTVSPPAATATASAPLPTVKVQVPIPVAAASASGPVPTVTTAIIVAPPAATASASAPGPTPQLRLVAALATAAASSPTGQVGVSIIVPAASAAASSPVAALRLNIPISAASAMAAAIEPLVFAGAVVVLTAPFTTSPQGNVANSPAAGLVSSNPSGLVSSNPSGER